MVYPQARAVNISIETNKFNTGATEGTVEFMGGGVDSSLGLSVQTGLYIDEVRMSLSSVAQPAGSKAYPSNIMLDFGGDRVPEWTWQGPGFGGLGRQTMFVNNKPYMNASVPMGGGYNDSVAFRLPKTATVKTATMNISAGGSIGAQGAVLVLNACNSYYGWQTDPVNRLKTFTSDFSQVDRYDAYANTPTWDDIKGYSAILTYSDWNYGYGYRDATALGNLLADYVDAGGSLVCAFSEFYNGYGSFDLEGRFASDKYYVIQPSGSIAYATSGVGEIVVPGHPIMSNVSSISFNYYGYTYRTWNPTVDADATIVSKWGDGYIMAATKNVGGVERVDINMWPVSQYVGYAYMAYYGDGDDLIKNALLFGGRKPINAAVDVFRDGSFEFNRTGFTGNYTLPDFSAAINSYIATAPVSYEDKFGNKFVDIPMNVTSPTGGRVSLGALSVTYDYTTEVDVNPANGNLTMSVSDLQSSIVGEEINTIPIYISSSSSGKIRLHGLYVRMSPPIHKPRIDSFYPPLQSTSTEGDSMMFIVNATDIYKNPMTYTWFYDDERMPGTASTRLNLDFGFEDAGEHTVTVKVANGITDKTYTNLTWTVNVLNFNRPPQVITYSPSSDVTLKEADTQMFSVVAEDPDVGDPLTYSWLLDGVQVEGAAADNWTYAPGFADSGLHTIKAVVADSSGTTDFHNWQATVTDVNVLPLIQSWSPKQDPRITETETVEFSITAVDPDKDDRVVITWFVDNAQVFVGNPFSYISDYKSAGVHTIKATASDGDGEGSHTWALTVDDLNRPPFASIDSPLDGSEYMDGQVIHFSAKFTTDPDNETLSFTWKEGGVNVSDQTEFDRTFPPGLHTITLEVRDRAGATASAMVRFRVRYVEISTAIGLDRFEVQAGNKVSVILTMSNMGDANATNLAVEVLVDGRSIGTTTVKDLRPGGVEKAVFEWTATKGPHTITAKVGDKTWTKGITVSAAPPPPPSAGIGDYAGTIVIVVIVVALVAFGGMVLRRK
jgi:hypothetical protein